METMHMSSVSAIVFSVIVTLYFSDVITATICESPQFLKLYERGIINCKFGEDFFSVLWYNTAEYLENDPVLDFQDNVTTGVGYESGEYGVYPNGSLIINYVTLQHDVFTVAYLPTKTDAIEFIQIRVIGVDSPDVAFPVIALCGNDNRYCYSQLDSSPVKCSVSKVRPAVMVNLYARTIHGDINISSEVSVTADGGGYTSSVTSVNAFLHSPQLVLLVCKASSPALILENIESMILLQNRDKGALHGNLTVRYVERDTMVKLYCSDKENGFVVWKKVTTSETSASELLLFSISIGETVTYIHAEDVAFEGKGSLVIPRAQVKHEGRYACIYGNGLSDGSTAYDVKIIVYPETTYPLIDGCDQLEFCVMEVQQDGILTCSIEGIRPLPQLKWQTYKRADVPSISFSKMETISTANGETFKSTLITAYSVRDVSLERLLLECVVLEPNASIRFSSKVYLQFTKDKTQSPMIPSDPIENILAVVMAIAFFAVLLGTSVWKIICKKKILSVHHNTEMTPTTEETPENANREKKTLLVEELRRKYADFYQSVQTVPYIKCKQCCVSKIFVESGIEVLNDKEGYEESRWVKIDSCNKVFDAPATRRILEGRPGYGKSTISLKYAYDWCTSNTTSEFKHVDILILLKLRQLAGIRSIYKAIKQILLAESTNLDEDDVKEILLRGSSVLLIFDGYEDFPDKNDEDSEINQIIAGRMFKNINVIVTTSVLPDDFPLSAKRYRLTGFDRDAREKYIHQAFDLVDGTSVLGFLEAMKESPIIRDFGHIPRMFVLWAHNKLEKEELKYLNTTGMITSKSIMDYLSKVDEKTKMIILCILGDTEMVDKVEEPIEELFSQCVHINGFDDSDLQRAYIHLTKIAATNKITITKIKLLNNIDSVVSYKENPVLRTVSGLDIVPGLPAENLEFSQFNRKMSEEEVIALMKFSSLCPSLLTLRLQISPLPRIVQVDSSLETLKSRNVKVMYGIFTSTGHFILNLSTGQWTTENGIICTDEDFRIKDSEWNKVSTWSEEMHKSQIKKGIERGRSLVHVEAVTKAAGKYVKEELFPFLPKFAGRNYVSEEPD